MHARDGVADAGRNTAWEGDLIGQRTCSSCCAKYAACLFCADGTSRCRPGVLVNSGNAYGLCTSWDASAFQSKSWSNLKNPKRNARLSEVHTHNFLVQIEPFELL